ncbi:MAG: hypothetical protein M1840_008005 [Geoglossum simile]|nr:MAG: hypothetical protein M1840_008005 [Geoglossum simile]
MSNNTVGGVYQRIIQDVIQNSAVDFEEAGVDGSTLEELKQSQADGLLQVESRDPAHSAGAQVWQRKLSSLNVAQFPWDPPVPAQVSISNPAPVPSNAPRHTSAASSQPPAPPSVPAPLQNGGARIKTEPGYEPDPMSGLQPSQVSGNPSTVAAMRAAGLLSQKFHGQAASQVNALQGKAAAGLILPGQQRPAMQYPGQAHSQQTQQQQNPQQQQLPQQHRSVLGGAQTDGTSDATEKWSAVMMRRNVHGQDEEMGTVEIDNLIRRGVEKMGVSMESGGLMLPLSELRPGKKGKKRRRATAQRSAAISALPPSSTALPSSLPRIPHFDGAGDDSDEEQKMKPEAFDEDAINSDLDDDEDLDEDDGDDESMSQIMLCTYDKVQRVKNKWKCVLKDGVLTINGKE